MQVELNADEMMLAGIVGLQRQVESIVEGRKPQFPEARPAEMFSTHILGAMAELAASKALGIEWEAHVNRFNLPDLSAYGVDIEVRWSRHPKWIKVKPADDDSRIVVLVTGEPPVFHVDHCARASYVKRNAELSSPRAGRPAHFLPVAEAFPIDTVTRYIRARMQAA